MTYWEKRQIEIYKAGEQQVNEYFSKLEKTFNKTRKDLRVIINDFYMRYSDENGLTFAQAQQYLNKAEVGSLKDFIALANENIGKYNQTVNNMSIKARITRYQELETRIDAYLRQLYAIDYEAGGTQAMHGVYGDVYYQTWYGIDQMRGYHMDFSLIDPLVVDKLIAYPFNGANFSSRLWKQKDHLQSQLMEALTVMMVQGKNPQALAGDFAKKTNSKKFDAYRLLHTESSFLMSEAIHTAYKEDGVKKYEILATLDSKTCEICGELDGKVFDVEKAVVGENMAPFHYFCRCTDMPYYDDNNLSDMTRAARDPDTGEYVEVPADMTYKEWKQKYATAKREADEKISGLRRNKNQLEQAINHIKDELRNYTTHRSRWSGKLIVDNARAQREGFRGLKSWSCNIIVSDSVTDDTLFHEMLHSTSCSYFSIKDYVENKKIEEGTVEFLTKIYANKQGISYNPAYLTEVAVLESLNNGLSLFDDDISFGKTLLDIPMTSRYDWLKKEVENGIIKQKLSSEQAEEVRKVLNYLQPGGKNDGGKGTIR